MSKQQTPLTLLGRILEWFNQLFKELTKRYHNAWGVLKALWRPFAFVLTPLARIGRRIGRWYRRRVFSRYAYYKDDAGNPTDVLSHKKAAQTVGISIIVVLMLYYSLSFIKNLMRDIWYIASSEEVTLYFGKPTYHADLHLYQVTACKSKDNCEGGDNALIFDIPDNVALDISYTFTRAKGYDPEHEIVSAFNSEYQQCTVTSKGKKPIIINYVLGTYRWHPKILDRAVCTPVVNMN